MAPPSNNSPQAVQDCHALIAWVIPKLDQFPRNRRFTLGERIESGLLLVLERLVEAAYSRNRRPMLQQANLQLEVVRHLWRLAEELKVISMNSYGHGAKLMVELGRQVGGWLGAQGVVEAQRGEG